MAFWSYAQNFEDLMLWRALKKVERGFYVDVGANDPVLDSVTKAFYDRGWRGINIEPVPRWYEKLVRKRPEDVNLKVAISDAPGTITLHDLVGTAMSTFDPGLFEYYRSNSPHRIADVQVPVVTLDSVLEQHAPPAIHFLKVDVEGWERQVFAGVDLERFRPWIILAEATYLDTWEKLVTSRGYDFVYFDGLNRFYLARERPDLKTAFNAPPNVLDNFVLARDRFAPPSFSRAKMALRAVYARTSSRITAPLSKVKDILKRPRLR